MKKVYSRIPLGILVTLLLVIIFINGIATYFDNAHIPNATKVASIVILLTLYYILKNRMANVFLTIFFLFFLGDVFSVFNFGDMADKLSKSFYLGSYLLLIFVMLGSLKQIKYEGVVSIYLILVFLLNSYFLYMLFGMVKENISDDVILVLYICHGIALIAMAFFAFAVYLSNETKQSIIFLVMVFCFVFSDVLNYISSLYVYYWMFDFVGNMLHLVSLCLLYVFVIENHESISSKEKYSREDYMLQSSEKLTA